MWITKSIVNFKRFDKTQFVPVTSLLNEVDIFDRKLHERNENAIFFGDFRNRFDKLQLHFCRTLFSVCWQYLLQNLMM